MNKFIVALFLICTMPALWAVELKLGHFAAADHPGHIVAEQFAANVAKRTGGQVNITIYPDNQLGTTADVLYQNVIGAIDMSLPCQDALARYVKVFDAVGMPFVFSSAEIADRVIDGDFKKWTAPELEKQGLVYLSAWEWGFRQVTNSKRPILKPQDMRGLKMRTPPALAYQSFVQALGGIVHTIDFSDLPIAIQKGVVDGQENPIGVIYGLKIYERQKYLSILNYSYSSMTHVVSKKTWDKLTPMQQIVIQQESDIASKRMRQMVRAQEAEQLKDMEARGVKIARPNLAPFKAAMGPAYEQLKPAVGTTGFQKFMKIVEKYSQ